MKQFRINVQRTERTKMEFHILFILFYWIILSSQRRRNFKSREIIHSRGIEERHYQMQALAHSLVFITLGCGTVSTKNRKKANKQKNNFVFSCSTCAVMATAAMVQAVDESTEIATVGRLAIATDNAIYSSFARAVWFYAFTFAQMKINFRPFD